jgi:hypothetical protein
MALQLVGAGLGRTGTHSLKVALEQLLGAPCYHMVEVFEHPDHVSSWNDAMHDRPVDWHALFDGYAAAVDWPAAGVWRPIAEAFPDAPVLLSTRTDADEWWTSAKNTIFEAIGPEAPPGMEEWHEMGMAMIHRFSPDWPDEDATKAAYDRHNAEVRAVVPPERLVEWRPADGWAPLCAALDLPVPDEPFPLTNTTAEFRARAGYDPV